MRPKPRGPKLPAQLLDEISNQDPSFRRGRGLSGPRDRKERRKAERTQKRQGGRAGQQIKRQKIYHQEDDESEDEVAFDEPAQSSTPSSSPEPAPAPPTKSSVKTSKEQKLSNPSDTDELVNYPAPKVSRKVQAELDEDDRMIADLEKKLGIKNKKKLPKGFEDDGLADLFAELDEEIEGDTEKRKLKKEGDEWLAEKRRKAMNSTSHKADQETIPEDEYSSVDDDDDDSTASGDEPENINDNDDIEDDASVDLEDEYVDGDEDENGESTDDFEGFDDDDTQAPARKKENPYVAPVSDNTSSTKYIPPSLRKPANSVSEAYTRLRRQTQGLINRLTEANMLTILANVEQLYANNPRHDVTSIITDHILTSVCVGTSLPDTLIILPAGFIAAVYKIIGVDFGAYVVSKIVELFDQHYLPLMNTTTAATGEISKETTNLITLLAELYNFHVVGSNLIFDYVRLFLERLSEINTELLLRVVRMSGPQLRQDDPSSLKDVVTMLKPAVAAVGEANISVRTKFMIETINDLKNNKMKAGAASAAITSEHTVRMKKMLGSLNTRNLKASEPLRIGLKDIADSDKKGKWWLIGASWAGTEHKDYAPTNTQRKVAGRDDTEGLGGFDTYDLAQMAREQRMNTDVRRAIFVTIMSASDYQDAYLRLIKLNLKRAQELDIPKVLIHCATNEQMYNPYYTLVSKRLCGDKRLRMAFQFSLWDLFKRMGEGKDDEEDLDDDEESLDLHKIVNLAKMYGTLIVDGGLGLTVLKHLNLLYLQSQAKTFVEVLLLTTLLQSQRKSKDKRNEGEIVKIMSKVEDMPALAQGLKYFLKKVVVKSDIAGGKADRATVKWACGVATDVLEAIGSKNAMAAAA